LHPACRSQDADYQIDRAIAKGIRIRKHWHTANETHTIIIGTVGFACDGGKRVEMGQGSFNSSPSMAHGTSIGSKARRPRQI